MSNKLSFLLYPMILKTSVSCDDVMEIFAKQISTCRYYRVLTMVYNTQRYWVFGLCPSSGLVPISWRSSFWTCSLSGTELKGVFTSKGKIRRRKTVDVLNLTELKKAPKNYKNRTMPGQVILLVELYTHVGSLLKPSLLHFLNMCWKF
jgi:hypothetical protein